MDDPGKKHQNAPARARLEHLHRLRPSKKLEHGDHLLFHHALRCMCQTCGRLLSWEGSKLHGQLEVYCCGIHYRMHPRSVIIEVEDKSSRPILPRLKGSNYADPEFKLDDYLHGETKVEEFTLNPLTHAQKSLRIGNGGSRVTNKASTTNPLLVDSKPKELNSGVVIPQSRLPIPPQKPTIPEDKE